jgi:hypothetical protein
MFWIFQKSYFLFSLDSLPQYNWNIVKSGIKHHQTNKQYLDSIQSKNPIYF